MFSPWFALSVAGFLVVAASERLHERAKAKRAQGQPPTLAERLLYIAVIVLGLAMVAGGVWMAYRTGDLAHFQGRVRVH
jgi:hypothetical protein